MIRRGDQVTTARCGQQAERFRRYGLKRHVCLDTVQDCLTIAVLGVEKSYGRSRVKAEGSWHLDRQRRTCTIDASTQVGQDIAQLFTGYLAREFGETAFQLLRSKSRRKSMQKAEAR